MATYTNLKDILSNFERIVVKGNHYTKAQSDALFQGKDQALNDLANLVKKGSTGAIVVTPSESSADTYNLTVKNYAEQSAVDSAEERAKSYADGKFQLKNEHLTALASLIGKGQAGAIEIVVADGSADPYLKVTSGLATETYVTTKISEIINGAPAALDTLKELSAALNNDANFASTVTNKLTSIDNSLSTYQKKNDVLTAIINGVANAAASGIIRVNVADSSAANTIVIDTKEYITKADVNSALSITDAELLEMVD